MIRAVLLCTFFIYHTDAIAQRVEGNLAAKSKNLQLKAADLKNLKSGLIVHSDSYSGINTLTQDSFTFSLPEYQSLFIKSIRNDSLMEISTVADGITLKEVKIISEMARFKQDSAFKHQLYKKEFDYARSKANKKLLVRTGEIGLTYNGLLAETALGISGKKKKSRKFISMLIADEEQSFINARYTNSMVQSVTGLSYEESEEFKARHLISYDSARAFSDLELKSWIMSEYKMSKIK